MATITPGTAGTFTSTTAEGQALEAIIWLQQREASDAANPNGENRIDGSIDIDLATFAGTFRIPATQSLNNQGQLILAASTYLSSGVFTPGSGGTFKSTTIEGYVLEVLMYLQILELQPAKNPQSRNYVTGSYNSDTRVYTGTFNFPVSLALVNGSIQTSASEYLLS